MLKKQKINFTQVQNELLIRDDMDFGLKGLFAYIMSKPDGWEFSSIRISKETKESEKTIKNMVNKLIDLGYIIRNRHHSGKITYETYLFPECRIGTVTKAHGDKSTPLSNTDNKSNTKNIRKSPKIYDPADPSYFPNYINEDLWNDFKDLRKKLKAQNTLRALSMILNKLREFEAKKAGNANKSLEESIMNSWKGVFEPKQQYQNSNVTTTPPSDIKPSDEF